MMGQRGIAQDVALQNVEAFAGDHDVILTLCASCASHLKHGYAELFAAQPDRLPEIRAFADKVMDFSTFAHERLGLNPEDFRRGTETVTYHASCHLCGGLMCMPLPGSLSLRLPGTFRRLKRRSVAGSAEPIRRNFRTFLRSCCARSWDGIAATGAQRVVGGLAPAAFCISGAARKRTAPASE